jgi:hypothetical protein
MNQETADRSDSAAAATVLRRSGSDTTDGVASRSAVGNRELATRQSGSTSDAGSGTRNRSLSQIGRGTSTPSNEQVRAFLNLPDDGASSRSVQTRGRTEANEVAGATRTGIANNADAGNESAAIARGAAGQGRVNRARTDDVAGTLQRQIVSNSNSDESLQFGRGRRSGSAADNDTATTNAEIVARGRGDSQEAIVSGDASRGNRAGRVLRLDSNGSRGDAQNVLDALRGGRRTIARDTRGRGGEGRGAIDSGGDEADGGSAVDAGLGGLRSGRRGRGGGDAGENGIGMGRGGRGNNDDALGTPGGGRGGDENALGARRGGRGGRGGGPDGIIGDARGRGRDVGGGRDGDHRNWSGRWRDGDRFAAADRIRNDWKGRGRHDDLPFRSGWWRNHGRDHHHHSYWNVFLGFSHFDPFYWWSWCPAPRLSTWFSFGWPTPYYWDYGFGEYIYCYDHVVYVNGSWFAPAPIYYQQTLALAQTAPVFTPQQAVEVEWLPLGVFAVARDGAADANLLVQLAVTADGVIGGTALNQVTGASYPIEGTVDKQTQRAAWTYVDDTGARVLMESSVYNLTQPEATGLIHYNANDIQVIELIRLEQPTEGGQ